ncbi:Receptor-like protein 12, partial [Mucuna pruriens]
MESRMGMGWLFLVCWHLLLLFHFAFSHSQCHPQDSFALLQFKNSFTVDTTYYYYYDICPGANPKTATWKNGTDCCSWLGVTCNNISGHVTELDLACSGLYGKIHPNSTLFLLSHLQSLNLAFNDFFQSPLSSLFGGFVSLTHLNLSCSSFQGEIPSQISHLSKLQSLDLSLSYDDKFQLNWKESTWKRLLQNATVLRELVLNHTDLSSISMKPLNLSSSLITLSLRGTGLRGKLTDDTLCLPNLQHLYLSGNLDLHGQLPNLSCSAASLRVLQISTCEFQGPIPPSFSNLTRLTFLDLSFNNLNGSIPPSLITLPRLTFLYLYYNHLSGLIPNFFHLSNIIEVLDLSYNNIGGELPSTLSNLQHLIYLDLSYNKLEGPLPNQITGFSNLTFLVLDYNLLNGTIPSWCFSLPSLLGLYLSNNQFTGHITEISSYSLEILDLCNNKLHGNIPESIFSLGNLRDLCLSSNNLSGPINFELFSKFQNLEVLSLSQNSQLWLNFESNVTYNFSRLEALDLSSGGLTEFPKLSGKLPNLRIFDLSNNKLSGTVPNWLHEIDSLYALVLSKNLLTTPMDQFSRNYQLRLLDLSFNLLTGGISSSICNASSIEALNLSHNKLTGIIPQCLVNLQSLRVLDLQMNKLYGTLPSTISKINQLSTLNLNGNKLKGPLPESLSNCMLLEVLNLGNNQIEGTFPHWLQTLPYLTVLVLRANKLHGLIATIQTKNMFPSLIIFDISCNNFSGPIPKAYIKSFAAMKNVVQDEVDSSSQQYIKMQFSIGLYTSSVVETTKGIYITFNKIPIDMTKIDLSENIFEGEIPNVIGELHALKGLNLSHNRLSGHIPQSMGNLTNLESLDLSSNMFTGRIPTELTNLNSLEVLNLSYNHLVGEIPKGAQFNTFSNDSYVGNLGLCGLPLSMKCIKDPRQHSPPSLNLWREESFGFGWKPVAIGYGCGMVFGVSMGCCVLLIGKPLWLVRMFGG